MNEQAIVFAAIGIIVFTLGVFAGRNTMKPHELTSAEVLRYLSAHRVGDCSTQTTKPAIDINGSNITINGAEILPQCILIQGAKP